MHLNFLSPKEKGHLRDYKYFLSAYKSFASKEDIMNYLGIESTAHTFGVGIVSDKGKFLANEKDVYAPKKGGGIIPHDAALHHMNVCDKIIDKTLKKSGLKIKDIDLISFSAGPGLPPCLRAGAAIARYMSLVYKLPLVGVNHCIAHIEIGKLTTNSSDPVVLYLSGGNTQVVGYTEGRYRIFGETEDIPVGNAFDVLARELRLKTPGGPEIEKTALNGNYVELPYTVKGMNLSFTGITTDSIKKFKNGLSKEDVCYSFQENCFAMLTEVTERALAHTGKKEVLLVGGVAANKRLQSMLKIMCKDRGAELFVVPSEYAGDCGVNIAWTGLLNKKQKFNIKNTKIRQSWRTDEVEVNWLD